ncbi:MAG TPA: dienelactone hydrolase family protein [Marmoricola sp.]|nr:dienelactone hydrolase family protein [Marmoricola sp.]
MAEVVLFHHVCGLTPGVVGFADQLRSAGHTVHTPDVFDGKTFASIESGLSHVQATGFEALLEHACALAANLPAEVVYAGFSFGVMPAEKLVITRPGAVGALFFDSCAPAEAFGSWPDGVPLQVHGMASDPFFAGEGDLDAARELVGSTDHGELFVYPGDRHLFADSSLPSYDADAAGLLTERALAFLDRLPA